MTETITKDTLPSVHIEEEMKRSYLDYAMSVIVSRALPDVRDGLKPVHRRILFTMKEGGYEHNKPFRKSAHVVGTVMAKYHPHGDQAIYDSMVRMAQDFSLRVPLIDGQGNFGSMDGDKAAAMRYTEARLQRVSQNLLEHIDKDTVDFQPSYDGTNKEPVVLPAKFPNLLVNGAGGIAVGMATNIPPHNLGEVIDGCCALIDNPQTSPEELMDIIPGPDFPTGGLILGRTGIRDAHLKGRGSIIMRARTHVEDVRKDRPAIIVTEVPYQINKAKMLERIAECVKTKVVEGIADLRDESNREGVRVVIELKRDAVADVVLSQLFKHTPLQTSFGANVLALNHGRPEMMTLKQIIEAFIAFREDVIIRRTRFDLEKAREKAHVLAGLSVAVANIDEVIALIRSAPDPQTAREQLMARDWKAFDVEPLIELIDEPNHRVINGVYKLSETQARAILELRLHRLTGLERDKIAKELEAIAADIKDYLDILSSHPRRMSMMREELVEIKENFATPRRTTIEDAEFSEDLEDLIQREDMVVTVSHGGYIKRVPLSTYRAQKRGGKGRTGMATRDEDFVQEVFVANTHTPILFFSTLGRVYQMKVYRLPLSSAQGRGKAMINMLPLEKNETISTVMPLPDMEETNVDDMTIMFATSKGNVRRNKLSDFTNIRANGKIAMGLVDTDEQLIGVSPCDENNDVFITTHQGKCIRFPVENVRVFNSRNSTGVRGIRLSKDDKVISMTTLTKVSFTMEERDAYLSQSGKLRRSEIDTIDTSEISQERFDELAANEEFILSVTENGFGKRTSAYEYRITSRGGVGIANMTLNDKTGPVVASFPVCENDQMMLVTDGGQMIRFPLHDIRIAGRSTQGVTLFKVGKGEKTVSAAHIPEIEGDEDEEEMTEEE